MSSFSIDGKRSQELGLIMLRATKRPILPSTTDRTLPIPGRAGQWDFGADLGARLFEIECAFNTKNPYELQRRVMELAAFLVDSYGRPREVELRFDTRPDQYFVARYSGSLAIDRVAGLGKFTLPMMAYDPFAYGHEKIYESTIETSPFVFEIESSGNVRTNPLIVMTNHGTSTIRYFRIQNEYRLE
ncbi:distal tail protein Dit [Paenibacillus apiarius]|uniref:distal tail protein Dit n=1 Tax=Paenibacillus apiarius TaxID=46240 RepID=UPI003B3ABA6C